jgi:hypothetical protein
MHIDCFKLLVREGTSTQAMRCLWTATSWRSPWKGAPELYLEDATSTAVVPSLAVERAHLVKDGLPPEINRIIHRYSASSLLWAYGSAIRLAHQIHKAPQLQGLVSASVRDISCWERGDLPSLVVPLRQSTVRLTIDARGILKIERLTKHLTARCRRSDHLVFVIVKDEDIADAMLHFKVRSPPYIYIKSLLSNKSARFLSSRTSKRHPRTPGLGYTDSS